jgi:ABC-type multidrug transport system fused ATPase/permease subunit
MVRRMTLIFGLLLRIHLIKIPAGPMTVADTKPPTNTFGGLETDTTNGGINLSHGQRQLICLARSILSRSKTLVLDEATSAIDIDSDTATQHAIQAEFSDSTMIVIAHRLSTVANSGKLIVVRCGRIRRQNRYTRRTHKSKKYFWAICFTKLERGARSRLLT